jgi:hypothetical protein
MSDEKSIPLRLIAPCWHDLDVCFPVLPPPLPLPLLMTDET